MNQLQKHHILDTQLVSHRVNSIVESLALY